MAKLLLKTYGQEDIAARLRDLSRNVNRESETLVDEASHPGEQREANDKQLAAGDIIHIGGMINAVAAGQSLQRDEVEGNGYLRLFSSPHREVDPPIRKCLDQIGSWCIEQGVILTEERAESFLETLQRDTTRLDKVVEGLAYIDKTAALLVAIG